jgi:hypothetical protein
MPSRILIHPPEPELPRLVDLPARRAAIGEEVLPGWKACDYSLIRGDWHGEQYEYEVWIVPVSSDAC